MASENKQMKLKHSNAWGGAGKAKNTHMKKFLWFTSAQRRENNKFNLEDC